jgi:hypothetical protein
MIALRQSYTKITDDLRDIFRYHFDTAMCYEIKEKMAKYYKTIYGNILKKLSEDILKRA